MAYKNEADTEMEDGQRESGSQGMSEIFQKKGVDSLCCSHFMRGQEVLSNEPPCY